VALFCFEYERARIRADEHTLHIMQAILALSRESFGLLDFGLASSLLCTRKLSPFPAELLAVRMVHTFREAVRPVMSILCGAITSTLTTIQLWISTYPEYSTTIICKALEMYTSATESLCVRSRCLHNIHTKTRKHRRRNKQC
jgi:hypothetical protein